MPRSSRVPATHMRPAHALSSLALVLAGLWLAIGLALAQAPEPKRSPLGVGPAPVASGTAVAGPGAEASWWGQAVAAQQRFMRGMADAVRSLKSADPWSAALLLAGLSFTYGVLHAAGPGHGKAVISSYVLANRDTARRGIALSFLAALFQAISAIVFVGVLALAVRATSLEMKSAERWIETVSWVFVVGIGVWLLWRQLAPSLAQARATPATGHDHSAHGHHDHHAHGHDHRAHAHTHGHHDHHAPGHTHAHAHHHHTHSATCTHGHDPGHVHGPDCGHAHMPSPQELEGPWSWRRALAIAVGIGMRPCTGAILVMIFALGQGLLWAGVFATFMMSLGTAITVSALAVLAITSRDVALRLAGGSDGLWGRRIATSVGVLGAVVLIAIGVVGLAYPTPEPMFMTR